MKIGSIEGTDQEIKNFFENHGLNVSDYLEKPSPELARRWIIIPSILFVICIVSLSLKLVDSNEYQVTVFLIGICSVLWLAISVNIRFKTQWGLWTIIFVGILILSTALGLLSPIELLSKWGATKSA